MRASQLAMPAPECLTGTDLRADSASRITICGLGLLTALGDTPQQTWRALLQGRSIQDHGRIPDVDTDSHRRIVKLAWRASRQALSQAAWNRSELADPMTALVVGTSKGLLDSWLSGTPGTPAGSYLEGGQFRFGMQGLASSLSARLGLSLGPRLTVSSACASGLQALIRAALMLQAGEAHRVLVVAAESSFHPLLLASYRRLGVLARTPQACRPFDARRSGFLISESAAAVCLQSQGPVSVPGRRATLRQEARPSPTVTIDRFALAGDATHLTACDAAGAGLRYLLRAVINGRPVDLIHAHGTGTVANDALELAAIEAELPPGSSRPICYSHKGALGHSLGAAGLVSMVLNCLAHQEGIIPGNVNTEMPLAVSRLTLSRYPVRRLVSRSVVLASGFGGTMAAVSLCSNV